MPYVSGKKPFHFDVDPDILPFFLFDEKLDSGYWYQLVSKIWCSFAWIKVATAEVRAPLSAVACRYSSNHSTVMVFNFYAFYLIKILTV